MGMMTFAGVVSTIAKLAKTCALRITSANLYFILSERLVNGGVAIWCELAQSHFFNEFNMDGVSEEANEIFLELTPDSIVKSLKSAQNAKSVKIKLTKKHVPCLTFEVELPSLASHSRIVVHDVPVNVVPRRLWDEYEEPEMPDFHVSLYMPDLKLLRSVVERMKNLSHFLTIAANQNGSMNLKVETDIVTVTTHFEKLEQPTWSRDEAESQTSQSQHKQLDAEEFAEARIDIRKLVVFLAGQQVNPTRVICNIVDNRLLHFFMLHDDLSLQYFIPVTAL